jgi:hypothetical protein
MKRRLLVLSVALGIAAALATTAFAGSGRVLQARRGRSASSRPSRTGSAAGCRHAPADRADRDAEHVGGLPRRDQPRPARTRERLHPVSRLRLCAVFLRGHQRAVAHESFVLKFVPAQSDFAVIPRRSRSE